MRACSGSCAGVGPSNACRAEWGAFGFRAAGRRRVGSTRPTWSGRCATMAWRVSPTTTGNPKFLSRSLGLRVRGRCGLRRQEGARWVQPCRPPIVLPLMPAVYSSSGRRRAEGRPPSASRRWRIRPRAAASRTAEVTPCSVDVDRSFGADCARCSTTSISSCTWPSTAT